MNCWIILTYFQNVEKNSCLCYNATIWAEIELQIFEYIYRVNMKGIYNYMKKQYLDWKKLFQIIAVVLIIEFAFLIGAYHQIH